MSRCSAMLLVIAMLLAPAVAAKADTRVRVLETSPAGSEVILPANRDFHVRMAYDTDRPVQIWARPYFRGEPARAGSHPSRTYTGSGEALGWFFLNPGAQVDEIRITAGDGGRNSTPVVATHRVRVVTGPAAGGERNEPSWVTTLLAADAAAREADAEAYASRPTSTGDVALFGGFMLLALALGVFGLGAPLWALLRWRGGWRFAAMVPAALMGFVVLRIVVGIAMDPTSHNLWPFEIVMAGGMSALAMLVLFGLRKFRGVHT